MKKDLKRILKYLLFPLICVLVPFFLVAAFCSFVLFVMQLETMSEYPTVPFVAVYDWWSGLSEEA